MLCSIQFDYARDAELVNVVRKDLAMALKALFQHGLVRVSVKGEQRSFRGLLCHKQAKSCATVCDLSYENLIHLRQKW